MKKLVFLILLITASAQSFAQRVDLFDSVQAFTDDMYVWILDPNSSPQSHRFTIWRLRQEFQPRDANLTAIAGLSTTGLIKRTGDGTTSIITDNSVNWNTAYNDKINSIAFDTTSGNLALTQQDAGTIIKNLDGRYSLSGSVDLNAVLHAGGLVTGPYVESIFQDNTEWYLQNEAGDSYLDIQFAGPTTGGYFDWYVENGNDGNNGWMVMRDASFLLNIFHSASGESYEISADIEQAERNISIGAFGVGTSYGTRYTKGGILMGDLNIGAEDFSRTGFEISNQGIFVRDTAAGIGMRYINDYSPNGSQHDNWIANWGAIKNLVDTSSIDLPSNIVYVSGTPVDNQLAIWTTDSTAEGNPNLTYDVNGQLNIDKNSGSGGALWIDHSVSGNGITIIKSGGTGDAIDVTGSSDLNGSVDIGGTLTISGTLTSTGGNATFNGTGALKVHSGTTLERPTGINSMVRYNTTIGKFEGFEAGEWKNMITSAPGITIGSSEIAFGDASGNLISSGDFEWIDGNSQLWLTSFDVVGQWVIFSPGVAANPNPGPYFSIYTDDSNNDASFSIWIEDYLDTGTDPLFEFNVTTPATSRDIFRLRNGGTTIYDIDATGTFNFQGNDFDNVGELNADKVSIGDKSLITIASGSVTITTGYHLVGTEGGAASDDLDNITGGVLGQTLVLSNAVGTEVVSLTENGNIDLEGAATPYALSGAKGTIMLIYDGTSWNEVSRSSN